MYNSWQVYTYPAMEKLTVLNGHMGTVNTIALDATDRCARTHASSRRASRMCSASAPHSCNNVMLTDRQQPAAVFVHAQMQVPAVSQSLHGVRHSSDKVPRTRSITCNARPLADSAAAFVRTRRANNWPMRSECCEKMACGPRGCRWLVSGGADATAAVWDLGALACVRACTQLDGEVKTSSVSADSQFLAYAGDQDAVVIEALRDGAQLLLRTQTLPSPLPNSGAPLICLGSCVSSRVFSRAAPKHFSCCACLEGVTLRHLPCVCGM